MSNHKNIQQRYASLQPISLVTDPSPAASASSDAAPVSVSAQFLVPRQHPPRTQSGRKEEIVHSASQTFLPTASASLLETHSVAGSSQGEYSAAGHSTSPKQQRVTAADKFFAPPCKSQDSYTSLVHSPIIQKIGSSVPDWPGYQYAASGISTARNMQTLSPPDQVFAPPSKKIIETEPKNTKNQEEQSHFIDSHSNQAGKSIIVNRPSYQHAAAILAESLSVQAASSPEQTFTKPAKKISKRKPKKAKNEENCSSVVDRPGNRRTGSTVTIWADCENIVCSSLQAVSENDQIIVPIAKSGAKKKARKEKKQGKFIYAVDSPGNHSVSSTVDGWPSYQYAAERVSTSSNAHVVRAREQIDRPPAKKPTKRKSRKAKNQETLDRVLVSPSNQGVRFTAPNIHDISIAAQESTPTTSSQTCNSRVDRNMHHQSCGLRVSGGIATHSAVSLQHHPARTTGQPSAHRKGYCDRRQVNVVATTAQVLPPNDGSSSDNVTVEQNNGDHLSRDAVNESAVSSLDNRTPENDKLPSFEELCTYLYGRPYFLLSDAASLFVP